MWRRSLALFGIVLALVIFATLLFFYQERSKKGFQSVDTSLHQQDTTLGNEEMLYLAPRDNKSAVYRYASGKESGRSEREGKIISTASQETGAAHVIRLMSGEYALEVSGKTTKLASAAFGLTISPNGQRFAFGSAAPGVAYSDPLSWQVRIGITNAPDQHEANALGFSPFFLDDARLLYFSKEGVYIKDVAGKDTPTEILKRQFPRILAFVSQSPDRALIAWSDPVSKKTEVYRISGNALKLVKTFEREFVQGSALGNDALYAVRVTGQGSEIWRHPFVGDPAMVQTLPATLQVKEIALPVK